MNYIQKNGELNGFGSAVLWMQPIKIGNRDLRWVNQGGEVSNNELSDK